MRCAAARVLDSDDRSAATAEAANPAPDSSAHNCGPAEPRARTSNRVSGAASRIRRAATRPMPRVAPVITMVCMPRRYPCAGHPQADESGRWTDAARWHAPTAPCRRDRADTRLCRRSVRALRVHVFVCADTLGSGPVLRHWLWWRRPRDRRLVTMTTLLLIAVTAAVAVGTFDSVAPGSDRAGFRLAVLRARHSLTDWDGARAGNSDNRSRGRCTRSDCL